MMSVVLGLTPLAHPSPHVRFRLKCLWYRTQREEVGGVCHRAVRDRAHRVQTSWTWKMSLSLQWLPAFDLTCDSSRSSWNPGIFQVCSDLDECSSRAEKNISWKFHFVYACVLILCWFSEVIFLFFEFIHHVKVVKSNRNVSFLMRDVTD